MIDGLLFRSIVFFVFFLHALHEDIYVGSVSETFMLTFGRQDMSRSVARLGQICGRALVR